MSAPIIVYTRADYVYLSKEQIDEAVNEYVKNRTGRAAKGKSPDYCISRNVTGADLSSATVDLRPEPSD